MRNRGLWWGNWLEFDLIWFGLDVCLSVFHLFLLFHSFDGFLFDGGLGEKILFKVELGIWRYNRL